MPLLSRVLEKLFKRAGAEFHPRRGNSALNVLGPVNQVKLSNKQAVGICGGALHNTRSLYLGDRNGLPFVLRFSIAKNRSRRWTNNFSPQTSRLN
jgi:hypothetical protein